MPFSLYPTNSSYHHDYTFDFKRNAATTVNSKKKKKNTKLGEDWAALAKHAARTIVAKHAEI